MNERHDRARVVHRCACITNGTVELVEELQPLCNDVADRIAERADTFKIFRQNERLFCHIQSGHCDGHARREHDFSCLGIYENVELRCGRPVAGSNATAHEGNASNLGFQFRVGQQQRRNIRLRTGCHDSDRFRRFTQHLRHQFRRRKCGRFKRRFRQGRAVQSRLAVNGWCVHHVI